MSLYQEWQDLIENQTEETFEAFWKEYAETETKIYSYILENHQEHLKGTVGELVDKFQCNKIIFVGFLDGVNSSLNSEMELNNVDENTSVDLYIDFEKLFFNMFILDIQLVFESFCW